MPALPNLALYFIHRPQNVRAQIYSDNHAILFILMHKLSIRSPVTHMRNRLPKPILMQANRKEKERERKRYNNQRKEENTFADTKKGKIFKNHYHESNT